MSGADEVQVVTFRLGGQDFAFNIFQVERILRYEEPSALPQAPAFLEGMIRVGERVVPVVDLRKRVSVDAPHREETRIMILEWEDGSIGIVVDAVLEVLKVPAAAITPPPKIVRGLAAKYISGIISHDDRTIVVLSAPALLTSKERLEVEALVEVTHE
jgi:purine-binding chemotaxis protein CheW